LPRRASQSRLAAAATWHSFKTAAIAWGEAGMRG
jgi:hypothetical protein